jgi:hypothetical protein
VPNASTTQQISSADTSGSPIALAYGYQWVTGKRLGYTQLQNTGTSDMDFTRIGLWGLGEGEWDGCNELWINDVLTYTSETGSPSYPPLYTPPSDNPWQFHFHRGADSVIGSGLAPASVGPDQGVDSLWKNFPPGVQPLTYNRIAYYALSIKYPIIDSSLHQNDPSQWADVAPIGLWRARRVRLFDSNGNQTGYAFTTNPAWHIVDACLARKIKPDYNIDLNNGPTPLTAAEAACFDWPSITASAIYFDQLLANGRRRFTGNYCFTSAATLNAILEQMLLVCRSHMHEYAGKIYLICDQPRASTFIISRDHTQKFEPSDEVLHTSANRFIGKFRDLLIPACATIASITGGTNPVVTTELGHPCQANDDIVIGGEGVPYDGYWAVGYVPALTADQIAAGVQVYTMTLVGKGSNYATDGPAGGTIGLIYSRFKERAPAFQHNQNQLARGAIGLGIAAQKKKVSQTLDLSVLTYDQTARIVMYERDRALGQDVAPYVTPPSGSVVIPFFARDVNGNLAAALKPGDRITLDTTANVPYAGDYEFIDATIRSSGASALSKGVMTRTAAEDSLEMEIILGPYSEACLYDSSSNTEAGWVDVPGSDPGNESGYTGGATIDGGSLAFISGALPSGSAFPLPSIGYPPANVLSWASPRGYLIGTHPGPGILGGSLPELDGPLLTIPLCSVNAALRTTLQYSDGVNRWGGEVNYAALAWSNGTVVTVGPMTYVIITLSNGEIICFGQGIVPDGDAFGLPEGFTPDKMFTFSSPYDNGGYTPVGHWGSGGIGDWIPPVSAHGFQTWVDSVVHMQFVGTDGSTWSGRAQVLVFAWQNNSGACTVTDVTGGSWMTVADTTSSILGVGLVRLSHGQTLPVPAVAASATKINTIASPRSLGTVGTPAAGEAPFGGYSWVSGSQVDGVTSCYLDTSYKLWMKWTGPYATGLTTQAIGSWNGDAMVFGIFWGARIVSSEMSSPAPGITITPTAATLIASVGYQQFRAPVVGESDTDVTWSVDGVAGGNSTVGMVDATGLYASPSTAGSHTITATSVADSSLTASAAITVSNPTSSGGGSEDVTVDFDWSRG